MTEGKRVQVLKPSTLKRGFFFKVCRKYRSDAGILYDYKLYNRHGRELKVEARGVRQYLAFKFPTQSGKPRWINIHRLFAFNSRCNFLRLPFLPCNHVHHNSKPKARPWTNCKQENMSVVDRDTHERWHRKYPDVPKTL